MAVKSDSQTISTNSIEAEVKIFRKEDGFTHFECPDCQFLNRPGQPAIPWKAVDVLLPLEADINSVSVSVSTVRFEEARGKYDIEPTPPFSTFKDGQLVQSWQEGVNIVDGRDIDIYDCNDFWPQMQAKITTTGRLRKYKLAQVAIPLVRFNPVTGRLLKLAEADVTVSFKCLKDEKFEKIGSLGALSSGIKPDRIGRSRVEKLAVNFEQTVGSYDTVEQSGSMLLGMDSNEPLPGYLIIAAQWIVDDSNKLNDFILHKETMGFNVYLITENDYGMGSTGAQTAENIRNWLKNNYIDYNIEYVLLIGKPTTGYSEVPMKLLYPRKGAGSDESAPSDLYYADLTGNWDLDGDGYYGEWNGDFGPGGVDRYWEVYVGRIPCYDDIVALDAILEKTINYENAYGEDEQWRKNVLLPMNPLDSSFLSFQLGEQIKDSVLFPNKWSSHRIYDGSYNLYPPPETTPCTRDNVVNVWKNNTFGLVVWMAHGTATYSTDVIYTSDAPLLNDAYPSFTFQASCSNSDPENYNNLSFALLQNGCVCTIGATRVSWYIYPWHRNNQDIDNIAYEYTEGLVNRKLTCGESLHELRQIYDPFEREGWMNFLVFNIYGDPSLRIIRSEDQPHTPVTYYVDVNSQSTDPNGLSWGEAFIDLQDAFEVACNGDTILVAEGVYTPAGPNGNRDVPFHIPCGVSVYGGFPAGGADFNSRDPNLYLTFLSGDLNHNDVNGFTDPSRSENSYRVVYGSCDFILDGFIITSAYGNEPAGPDTNLGGGMLLRHSNAVISNCKFQMNYAYRGGGVYNQYYGYPTFLNCKFINNKVTDRGAGLENLESDCVLRDCDFVSNEGNNDGGAIHLGYSNSEIYNCKFLENSSLMRTGGGIYCSKGYLEIEKSKFRLNYARGGGVGGGIYLSVEVICSMTDCDFICNSASSKGGALYMYDADIDIKNCVYFNNSAEEGGAIYNDNYTANLNNCTIYGNTASLDGSALYVYGVVYLNNCIVWDNDIYQLYSWDHAYLDHCCIQGGWPGVGNIDLDPLFADPNSGDFHLKSQAGRWDPNIRGWVQDSMTSPCIDAGNPSSDWTSELWPHGKRINMGAYGGTAEASMSLSNAGNIADINCDNKVDFFDMNLFSNRWYLEEILLKEDLNRDGVVDFADLASFVANWLWEE